MYVPPQAQNAICKSCYKDGCGLNIAGLAKHVEIIDLDRLTASIRKGGRIADCAVFWKQKEIFAVVELKGGQAGTSVDKIVEQIQMSLNRLDTLISNERVHDFYPVLMYRGKDPTSALNRETVTFRGISRKIISRECGAKLSSIRVR